MAIKTDVKTELEAHKKAIQEAGNLQVLRAILEKTGPYIKTSTNSRLHLMFSGGYIPALDATLDYLRRLDGCVGVINLVQGARIRAMKDLKEGAIKTIDAVINTL